MISQEIEYNIVLLGWVIALLLGVLMLAMKSPSGPAHTYYERGKNTCAMALILFGVEILFQWILRITATHNPILSVSCYLLTFCAATLLFATGFCTIMSPGVMTDKQKRMNVIVLIVYCILLLVNYLLPHWNWQVTGLIVCSSLLLIITCIAIVKCIVVYKRAIHNLRTYYSDLVENIMRWMPGVGAGILLFHVSAPFVCFCPRWVSIYQVALGIIMFIYTFICITNFSHHYSTVANAANDQQESAVDGQMNSLSESLKKVLQDKEQRWCERGGYRTPGLTIDQAARDMNTNRSYLSRYLNEVRHMTFYTWVAQMRIQEAQTLLSTDHDASIEQIAMKVGFTTASTFSSTFKKVVGMTPYQWRISRQNG